MDTFFGFLIYKEKSDIKVPVAHATLLKIRNSSH